MPVLPPTATPSGGGGSCSCAMPLLRSLAPSVGGCSLHSLRPLVGRRCRLSGRLSGLVCRSTRFRAGRKSGRVAGLVARVGAGRDRGRLPGWLLASGLVVIGEGCRAGCCSGGRISTKCSFSIVGLFLPSVAGSLSQSHAQLLRPTRGY